MWTLAFYLAMLAFFLPKKAKKVVAYISMGLTTFYFILLVLGWLFDFYIYDINYLFSFGYKLNPFYWLFHFVWPFVHKIENNIVKTILAIFVNMIEDGLQILLAFLALKYSFIKYKKDDLEETETEQMAQLETSIVEKYEITIYDLRDGNIKTMTLSELVDEVEADDETIYVIPFFTADLEDGDANVLVIL
jgi:hypothetical protein